MSVGVGRPNAPLILRGGGPLRGEGKTGKPSNRERCLGNHPLGNPWDGPGPQRLPFSRPTALELCVLARFWRASARSTGRRRASCLVPCSVIVFWRFSVLARFRHRSSSTHYRVGLWAPPPPPPSLSLSPLPTLDLWCCQSRRSALEGWRTHLPNGELFGESWAGLSAGIIMHRRSAISDARSLARARALSLFPLSPLSKERLANTQTHHPPPFPLFWCNQRPVSG